MVSPLRFIAVLVALLVPVPAAAIPLDRVYELDRVRSVWQACEAVDFSCRRGVVGRTRLSVDGDAATLEVFWFDLGPVPHEAIHRLPGDEIWSGIRSGRVVGRSGDSTRALFSIESGEIAATILADLSGDTVHFTGGDSRGYTYDFWGAAVPEPGLELLLSAILAVGIARQLGQGQVASTAAPSQDGSA